MTMESVLIVEDEFLLAMDVEAELTARGYKIFGVASHSEAALTLLADDAPDFAILDVFLRDGDSFAVADRLARQAVPFIFLSGNDHSALPDNHANQPLLTKPIDYKALEAAIKSLETETARA